MHGCKQQAEFWLLKFIYIDKPEFLCINLLNIRHV